MEQRQWTRREFLQRLGRLSLGLGLAVLGVRSLPACNPSPSRGPTLPPSSHELRFYRRLAEDAVRNCVIPPGAFGDCRNVKNLAGRAYNLVHSLPCALEVDPIEKEPAFHMLPGTNILCIATAGCNFRCKNCQNWEFSQRTLWEVENIPTTPGQIVRMAQEAGIKTIMITGDHKRTHGYGHR